MIPFLLLLVSAAPPAPATVPFEGPGLKRATYSVKDLEAFPVVSADFTDKGGRHVVKGVRLDALLLGQGFSEGAMGPGADPGVKHAGLRAAIVATATDGFQAVFSVGEVLPHLGPTQVLLVWEMDGKPLPESAGPFRLVVTTDKGASRSLYQLARLELVPLGKAAAVGAPRPGVAPRGTDAQAR